MIPTWKQRSEKWISSTFLESDWQTANCKYASSEYFMQNVTGKVFFQEACQHVPENAIVIEIAPHGILQAILKRSLHENTIRIPLTSKQSRNKTVYLLQSFGKYVFKVGRFQTRCNKFTRVFFQYSRLFEAGLNPSISKLYPPVRFPVSRGTKMLSPLIRWDHKQTWFVFKQDTGDADLKFGRRTVHISLQVEDVEFLAGHVIRGTIIMPGAGLLVSFTKHRTSSRLNRNSRTRLRSVWFGKQWL